MADETIHLLLGYQNYHYIALRLHDDLSNADSTAFKKAKFFREIFPDVKQLPYLMILTPDGVPLSSLTGEDVSKLAAQALQSAASKYPGPQQVLHRLYVCFMTASLCSAIVAMGDRNLHKSWKMLKRVNPPEGSRKLGRGKIHVRSFRRLISTQICAWSCSVGGRSTSLNII
jgi:hypothetical protein